MSIDISVGSLAPEALDEAPDFPGSIEGIPVRVREASFSKDYGRPWALSMAEAQNQRVDVLKPGASVAHFRASAGSIGAFVVCNKSGKLGALSNYHVFAEGGRVGDAILQPGPYDGGRIDSDRIGTLTRAVCGVGGSLGRLGGDIALPADPILCTAEVCGCVADILITKARHG